VERALVLEIHQIAVDAGGAGVAQRARVVTGLAVADVVVGGHREAGLGESADHVQVAAGVLAEAVDQLYHRAGLVQRGVDPALYRIPAVGRGKAYLGNRHCKSSL
jgi:hypothetical protein